MIDNDHWHQHVKVDALDGPVGGVNNDEVMALTETKTEWTEKEYKDGGEKNLETLKQMLSAKCNFLPGIERIDAKVEIYQQYVMSPFLFVLDAGN